MATIACRGCKREISDRAMTCPHCGVFVVAEAVTGDPSMRHIMPSSNLSGLAIAAGYLGLIAVLMIPAPVAFMTGIMAVRSISRDPTRSGLGRAWFGIVMGALGTVALVFMLIAAAKGK